MNISSGQSHSNDLQLLKELSSISELESISTPSINLIITESPGNGAGYIVKCCHCEAYLNDDPKIDQKVQRSIGSTFAGGHHIPLSTYEIYNKGSSLSNPESKRKWINFKSTLVQHHLLLTHKKAVEYHEKKETAIKRNDRVTRNIISIAIACVKSNAAARHFTPLLSTMALTGSDIGNIGHSR